MHTVAWRGLKYIESASSLSSCLSRNILGQVNTSLGQQSFTMLQNVRLIKLLEGQHGITKRINVILINYDNRPNN